MMFELPDEIYKQILEEFDEIKLLSDS